MRRALALWLLRGTLLLLGALPACSLTGLGDLPRDLCESDSDCGGLDALAPTGDACLTWQCDPLTSYCEPASRDDDGDSAPAMECADPGVAPDCDDADGTRSPGFAETCDQHDEDCDGALDEGLDTGAHGTLASVTSLERVVLAAAPDEDEVMAILGLAPGSMRVVTAAPGSPTTTVDAMLDAPGLALRGPEALAAIGGNRYALLLRPAGACARLAPAIVDTGATPLVAATGDGWADPGLPKPGGTCPAASDPVGPASLAARSLAGGAALMLASWVADGAERLCESAEPRDVVVAAARISRTGTRTASAASLVVGTTTDPGAPAIIAVADDRFLLARVSADGTIEIEAITVGADLVASAAPVHAEPAGGGPRGALSLALGEPDGEGRLALALAWRQGCSDPSSVHWRPLRVDPESGAITADAPARELATGAGLHAPRPAWEPRTGAWLLSWLVSSQRMEARRFDAAGAPLAPAFEAIPVRGLRAPTLLVPRQTGAAWGVAATRIDGSTQGVDVATAGCEPP